ncbi:MAG: hypothetical protein WAN22_19305 [Solirubrobacteraceae bacterium]
MDTQFLGGLNTGYAEFGITRAGRAAVAAEVAPLERERLANPEPGTPQQYHQRTKSVTVGAVTDHAHHRDDLLDRRRIGRVLLALVSGWTPSVIARHGRRRAAVAGDV